MHAEAGEQPNGSRQSSGTASPVHVFLDQNHWIYLARSYWGRSHTSGHASVAADLLSRVVRDEVRLPLDHIHLVEHLRDNRPDRRARLAEVFEIFSRRWFFASWNDLLPVEIRRACRQTFNCDYAPESLSVFGRGYLFGTGPSDREAWPSRFTDQDIEMFRRVTSRPGELYRLLTFPNEGNRDHQNTSISQLGLRNATAAEDLRRIRKSYPAETHRRAQYAGYTCDLQDHIGSALATVGKSFAEFLALGATGLSEFWRRVPSLDVDCELTVYRGRQWPRTVPGNDVWDIGHLVLAVPYCSAVVVERFWAQGVRETGLAEKYGVAVFTDLSDLMEWLG